MKKYIAIIFSLFLLNGCAASTVTKTENSIVLRDTWDLGPEEQAQAYCAEKGKVPDLVLVDGRTYKFECVDK